MTTDLIPHDAAPLAAPMDAAQKYAEASRAESTARAYRSDWKHFTTWCEGTHRAPLPAEPATVAAYVAGLAESGKKPATIARRLASISQAHQLAGFDSPSRTEMVRSVMKGIRRTHGTAQRQAAPATTQVIKAMVEHLPGTLGGKRDRALILLGFAGAFRRSELVSGRVEDVQFTAEGLVFTLRHSKTDQERQGTRKGIPYGSNPNTCPVRALRAWLDAASITSGPIFRAVDRWGRVSPTALSDRAVADIVKRCAAAAGFKADDFSGHSLRAGLATSAAAAGVMDRDIMKQTGHKSDRVLRRYIRDGSLFRDNAAGKVGL
jgi:site-specific recombinase XerD